MASIPQEYRNVLAEHRRRLDRVIDRRGLKTLRKVYEQAIEEVERRLAAIPGGQKDRFTAHQHRLYLGQLRQALPMLNRNMLAGLSDISREAQVEALRGLIDDIARLEQTFTGAAVVIPIEEAARFQGVISGVRESLLRVHETSVAEYGVRLITKMEDSLTTSLLVGDNINEATNAVMKTAGNEWWQAERIARTETMWAYNTTHREGMKDTLEDLPDMMMRWTEYVSDDFRPLDSRVDVDSMAMHGQVAPPDGQFAFPTDLPPGAQLSSDQQRQWYRVRRRFSGRSWANPPNRPNDRATLAPWRPHWGVPAWRWTGQREWL